MFYIILVVGALLAGSGIGGGSIFIMLSDVFKVSSHMEAIVYNLIMFITAGISASTVNIKSKNFDKSIFLKLVFLVIIFAFIGAFLANIVEENDLRKYFNIFILVIGVFEIIVSLKVIINEKNNSSMKKGE